MEELEQILKPLCEANNLTGFAVFIDKDDKVYLQQYECDDLVTIANLNMAKKFLLNRIDKSGE